MILNPYETYYSYDISEMVSTYSEDNLEVDDTLAILIIDFTLQNKFRILDHQNSP